MPMVAFGTAFRGLYHYFKDTYYPIFPYIFEDYLLHEDFIGLDDVSILYPIGNDEEDDYDGDDDEEDATE